MIKPTLLFGAIIGAAVAVPAVFDQYSSFSLQNSQSAPAPKSTTFKAEPKPKIVNTASLNGRTVVIPMDDRGHFQTDFKLNGRKINALVDTGATYVAMNKSTAARIGIKISAQDMNLEVSTANGQASAAAVMVNEIAIGKIRINNVQALVLEDKALDGLLMGMSFFKELDRFSIENRTLILEQ